MGVAVVLLAQALLTIGNLAEIYGGRGLVSWSVNDVLAPAYLPRISWLVEALAPWGVTADACLGGVFVLYLLALGCLLVGWRTPAAATVAWLLHGTLDGSSWASTYGVDEFARIALFYCIWMPVGADLSVDRYTGRSTADPSAAARLGLRVLQFHLCMAYLAAGIFKASGPQWWNGEAIWRAVMHPDFQQFDLSWLSAVPWLSRLSCWGTLVVEIGYAFFIWPRRTRKLWALATIGLHAGIAVTMGLWSFSALMSVLTGSAFLVSPEVRPSCVPRSKPAPVPELATA